MKSAWYDNNGKIITIDNFSKNQLHDLIQALDNDTRTSVKINNEAHSLVVCGGNGDRVKVLFSGRDDIRAHYGFLVDPGVSKDETEILIAMS